MWREHDRPPVETDTYLLFAFPSVECLFVRGSRNNINRIAGVKAISFALLFRWADTIVEIVINNLSLNKNALPHSRGVCDLVAQAIKDMDNYVYKQGDSFHPDIVKILQYGKVLNTLR